MKHDLADCWCNTVNGSEETRTDGVHAVWCVSGVELPRCPCCQKPTLFGCERDGVQWFSCIDVEGCGYGERGATTITSSEGRQE